VLGVFTIVLGIPLLVSAAYLVPAWWPALAEPIVAHAAPRLDKLGRAFAPFVRGATLRRAPHSRQC